MSIPVVVEGKFYRSLTSLARAYGQSSMTVTTRYNKGLTGLDLVRDHSFEGHHNREKAIIIKDKRFKSITQAAKYYGIGRSAFDRRYRRYKRHQITYEELINPKSNRAHPVVLQGVKYKSVNQAALKHDMAPSKLANRIKTYGPDSDLLFTKRNLNHKHRHGNFRPSYKYY